MDQLLNVLKDLNRDLKLAEIEGILYLLLNREDLTNTSLIQETGLPKETLRHFKTSISQYLEDPKGNSVKLSADSKKQFSAMNLRPYKWSLVPYDTSVYEESFIDMYAKGHEGSLPKRELDQFFALPSTSVSKFLLLKDKGLITDNNIAFLGDDDLVSVTTAKNDPSYKSIQVFDVDRSLLKGISDVAVSSGFKNFKAHFYDVRDAVSAVDAGRYDVVMTDPPYTKNGIKLFLNRAIELVGTSPDMSGKYILLFYGNSFKTPEKTVKIQELITEFGLVIEDKIDKFARYSGAESIGSASSVYVLKTTPYTHILEDALLINDLYTFSETKDEKFPFVEHYTFKLFNVDEHIVYSKNGVQSATGEFMKVHKLKVVDTKVTSFKNSGLSLTFILSSSNLLVHTWPEFHAVHIDLITCSPIFKKDRMAKTLSEVFKTKSIEIRHIE